MTIKPNIDWHDPLMHRMKDYFRLAEALLTENEELRIQVAAIEGGDMTPKEARAPRREDNPDLGYCSKRDDEQHCSCWWDSGKCCTCGHVTKVVAE